MAEEKISQVFRMKNITKTKNDFIKKIDQKWIHE